MHMLDLWYKNAIIYCLDVETFMDSDGDGIGDFQGLAARLPYLESLGVTCIWLLPFYPTPNRDNGYDITDFYGVDPRLGTSGDFVEFARGARHRGMRVIIDFVANHTSIQHPWFQDARSNPRSPYRDWYVWSKEKPENIHEGIIFPGVQNSIWSYDRVAKEWYLHRFYKWQADLNITNPEVREELDRTMGYWLELGVSGFRVDAAPFIIEYLGVPEQKRPETDPHLYLNHLQDFLSWRRAEAVLLAEANIAIDEVDNYFGGGERLNMIFNFMLNQSLFLALAQQSADPLRNILSRMPKIPAQAQWATFLRNHDELDLGRLPENEREEVYAAFGPEPRMQLYDRGIRRRLAPMLGGDERRLKLAHALMFALPGTPVIWYGDEIGMGDDLRQQERNSVRTPMQWSDKPNAGFSHAAAKRLVRPVISRGEFSYRNVNVAAQRDVGGSMLEHMQRLVRVRRLCPEIGWGDCRVVETEEPSVLGLRYDWRGGSVLALHNLADKPASVTLDEDKATPLLCSEEEPKSGRVGSVELGGYGFCWFRCGGDGF
jgi:maltose alpha-D-glucosyltransferase / alpha-amylase